LGRKTIRQELLAQVTRGPGPSHFGEAVQEAAEVRAQRLVTAGLKRLGWTEAVLGARRKGEPSKVELAQELRTQTTMSLAWIAQRLGMGSRGYLTWLLQRRSKNQLGQGKQHDNTIN
jgi:hypothetical protein